MTPRLRARARRRQRPDEPRVIDLRDGADTMLWFEDETGHDPEAERAREERVAAWAARLDGGRSRQGARDELDRLRRQHWSGERVLEEARRGVAWWELPDADPYAVLGILPGASLSDAAAARREIARECHPDRHPTGGAPATREERQRRMQAANAAYDRLRSALDPR
jgi:hypothetical protein